ncbi:MAG: hypothetical protein DHS20C19_09040 [Acidimicrobiales bacterium]|nr:MAG: hypothetical protein DHS20C19_09040 [Acidimicrobiales bacterium]
MILESLAVDPATFADATGWESKPEGLCKGDQCVPAPEAVTADGLLDVTVVADRLGMAIVEDPDHGLVALGPESGGRALTTTTVPDLPFTDADGNPFSLSSLHGRKVLLVAWASW